MNAHQHFIGLRRRDRYVAKLDRYGVNRADPDFWTLYDWFQSKADELEPVQAGIFDLNRYYRKTVDEGAGG